MELCEEDIADIVRSCPGDFALYALRDGTLRPLFNSPGLPALSAMTAEEYAAVTERDAADVVLASDRPHIAALLRALLSAPHDDIDFTYRIVHRQKGFIWIHAKSRYLGRLDGCPVLLTVFLNTSSEAEEHAELLRNASGAVYVIDRVTHELYYINDPTRIRDTDSVDFAGQTCHSFLFGRDTPCPWCPAAQPGGGQRDAGEVYVPELDRWFGYSCREMRWFGRDAVALCALNITETKRQQQNLEIDKMDLEKIIGNVPVGVGVFQIRNGVFTQMAMNPYIHVLLGTTPESFTVDSCGPLALVHPRDLAGVTALMRRLAEPGVYLEQAFRFRRPGETDYRFLRLEARTVLQGDTPVVFACLDDVTAEKEAEASIRRSRQMYAAAVETAQLVVWKYDIGAHRITLSNCDPYAACLPKEFDDAPKAILPFIDPKDAPAFLDMYRRIDSGEPTVCCEVCYRMQPGAEARCTRITLTNTYDAEGRPTVAWGIGQDITARKLEEEKYIRIYRQLAEANPRSLGAFRLNLTKNLCLDGQSPYPIVLSRLSSDTAEGHLAAVAALITSDKLRADFSSRFTRGRLLEAYRAGQQQLSVDFSVNAPDGRPVWVTGFVNMIQNPDSGDVEAITYATDITARKKSEAIIRRVTDEKCDYIGLLDTAARTIEFRTAIRSAGESGLHGKTDCDEYLRYAVEHFVLPEDRERVLRCAAIENLIDQLRDGGSYTVTFSAPGGERTLRKQLQYSYLNADRREILVVQTDITALYEQSQQQIARMEAALQAAQSATRAKSEFLSRISHDIRTPMNVISGMTAFAFEDMDAPDKLKNDLREIQASNTFLLSLINDILDVSKIDSGTIELHPEPYPYNEYVENLRSMFEPLCRQKDLRFVIEEGPIEGTVVCDRIRLNQIALNLLSNAVKYTPAGGTVTCVTSGRRLPDGRIDCRIGVRDTGIGMSEEFQEKMFEPFTQEYDAAPVGRSESGTGLGLSIVKRIVDLMGGTIDVKSAPGAGTDITVAFVFPAAAETEAAADGQAAPDTAKDSAPLRGRVLLAEDHPINAEIAQRLLENFGLEVEWVKDGREALERFAEAAPGTFDIVLMDIQMPNMNGCEASEAIRALDRSDAAVIPICAMTSNAYVEDVERCLRAGMNGHIAKPLDPKLLRQTLARLLP